MTPDEIAHTLTPKQIRFLKCFEACASISQAARWAKIYRGTHHDWFRMYEHYRVAFAEAEKVAARTLEDEAVRRAREGVRKPIYYQGKLVGYEQVYSDSLMALLLKGNLPKKYAAAASQIVSGDLPATIAGGVNLTLIIQMLMQELADAPELRARLGQKLMALDGNPG